MLVVDDNDDHRALYRIVLEAEGYRVVEASQGASAIAKAIALRPDVILLDFDMPQLDGAQACRWLKTSPETSHIPIVVFTGHRGERAGRAAIEAGCDRFVIKGGSPDDVVRAVKEMLSG